MIKFERPSSPDEVVKQIDNILTDLERADKPTEEELREAKNEAPW